MNKIYLGLLIILFANPIAGQNIAFTKLPAPLPAPQNTSNFDFVSDGEATFCDVDNDNDLDVLISGDRFPFNICKLYINDGYGNYSLSLGTPFTGVSNGSVAFADIDNDNDQDLLITGQSINYSPYNQIAKLYKNDGNGNFTLVTGTSFIGVRRSSIAFADVDNDNDQDVIITGLGSSGSISNLYLNNGLGVFTLASGTPFSAVTDGSIAFADVDNDNDQDVVITGNIGNSPSTKLYLNNGYGSFSLVSATPFEGVSYGSIAFADVDNDNDQDILITGQKSNNYPYQPISKLYKNSGSGVFTLVLSTPFDEVRFSSIAFADIDNDNDQDVLITGNNLYSQKVSKLYINNGSGSFSLLNNTGFLAVENGDVAFADIDNDNDPDVIICGDDANTTSSTFSTSLYINNGNSGFSYVKESAFKQNYIGTITFLDVDNDSDQDVIISGNISDVPFQNITELYLNDSTGQFTKVPWTPFQGVSYSSIVSADIDNDGDQDIFLTGKTSNIPSTSINVSRLYKNDGLGAFTMVSGTPFDSVIDGSAAFADYDNDSDQDLIISGTNSSYQAVTKLYANNGYGVFTLVSGTPFDGIFDGKVVFIDIDNDNDQDVFIVGMNALVPSVLVAKLYKNNGSSGFSLISGTPFDAVRYSSVDIADIDNDNDLDIILCGEKTLTVGYERITKLYKNNGSGIYSLVSGTSFDPIHHGVVKFADMDNDGDQDVFITGTTSHSSPYQKIAKVYANDGSGNYTVVPNISIKAITRGAVAFADINNDSLLDLFITGTDSTNQLTAALYKNTSCVTYATDTQVVCTPLTWIDGVTYTSNNYYSKDTLINSNGCDSIVTLHLTINSNSSTDVISACDSIIWTNGVTYTSSNSTATDTLINILGCDSVITLNLTINNTTSVHVVSACDSLTWTDGITYYNNNNIATDTFVNLAGCDHVVTLNLTVNHATYGTDSIIACDSLVWIDGNTYTTNNNTATYTLPNATACDSVITLDLSIINSSTSTDTIISCNSIVWIDGVTYSSSNNTATHTLINAAGCDSIISLDLTINSNTGVDVVTACDTFMWIDGITYTSNNYTATDTLTNAAGCDSVITLNLTLNSNTGTDIITACNSYTWIDGLTYTSSNNTATDTLINVAGCDSIVTLNLTINNTTYGTDIISVCDSFMWVDGITYTSSNNTATDTVINSVGCDSIITLNLTITNSTSAIDVIVACDSYTWIDGITYTSSNSTAMYILTNSIGCDSLISLNLTINYTKTNVDVISACNKYTWINGITYFSSNTTDSIVLTTITGCDSIVFLNLSLYPLNVSVTLSDPSIIANAIGVSYQWLDCNNNYAEINGETSKTFTASANGNYAVEITGISCLDTSVCLPIISLGILENPIKEQVNIYPNPSKGLINIDLGNLKEVDIIVFTVSGKLVYQKQGIKTSNYQFELNQVPGSYFIELSSGKYTERFKITISGN